MLLLMHSFTLKRKVDKAGCISFNGIKYDVGVLFIGCSVEVIYDPNDTKELTIECEGMNR